MMDDFWVKGLSSTDEHRNYDSSKKETLKSSVNAYVSCIDFSPKKSHTCVSIRRIDVNDLCRYPEFSQ